MALYSIWKSEYNCYHEQGKNGHELMELLSLFPLPFLRIRANPAAHKDTAAGCVHWAEGIRVKSELSLNKINLKVLKF